MGWRFRQQLRLTAPLAGRVRAFASSEAFFALDDTSWGQTGGFDRWELGRPSRAGRPVDHGRTRPHQSVDSTGWPGPGSPYREHQHIDEVLIQEHF